MPEIVVETRNVVKVYRAGKVSVKALDDVNINVYREEILGIIGPSGSGKTTLLNIISGLDKSTKGVVRVNGIDITSLSEERLARFRLENIGIVFQFYNLIPSLSVVENVELPLALLAVPRAERRKRALSILKELGLIHRAYFKPSELSGGESQRVAIARAIITNPKVILMDEPTGNLDSENSKNLMKFIEHVRTKYNATFVIASHDPIVIRRCERAYILRDGRVIEETTGEIAVEKYSKI
ncbi:MAG: ABC transporter ATP-binding protein [Desulfurococcaceae archaeon]